MPPKETAPKSARPVISECSLLQVPDNAVDGFQDRIEAGIEWNLLEDAARYHRRLCRQDIPTQTFSDALENKLQKSILRGFLDQSSNISLDEHWDVMLPMTLWDVDKMANNEGKICFNSINCITDDLIKLIKRSVKLGDREILKKEMRLARVLRVNDSQMTNLDEAISEFKNLVSLNLCGNFINNFDARYFPPALRTIELQANRITGVETFVEYLPTELLYLGLSRNFITDETIIGLDRLPQNLTILDLSNNDIYHLEPLLDNLLRLPNLVGLQLEGNPCSVSAAYARATLNRLQHLKWLDCREILPNDKSKELLEIHPDDLRSAYFFFTVYRVMSAPVPPKPEKGAVTTFHVELELPLLDQQRRNFLMFRRNESLIEMLPPAEDDESPHHSGLSSQINGKTSDAAQGEASTEDTDIFCHLTAKNSREICHFTTLESNRVQWNKIMNFMEPAVKIFCPDLTALRNTFRSVITVRLIYSQTLSKSGKADKKSTHAMKQPAEQRVVIASIKCPLRTLDWSQPSQHFHWDDSLESNEALHWGDGDLSVLQYSQGPVKTAKGRSEIDSRQAAPDNLTCHFGFGIETLRTVEMAAGTPIKNKRS